LSGQQRTPLSGGEEGWFGLESAEIPQGDKPTKILIDYNRCESNARCMQVAPDIFEVRDDDMLYVLEENPPESARERVLKAVQVCPKQAISIIES
jgi:ferredoxin